MTDYGKIVMLFDTLDEYVSYGLQYAARKNEKEVRNYLELIEDELEEIKFELAGGS